MSLSRSTSVVLVGLALVVAAFYAMQPKPGTPSAHPANDKPQESWQKVLLAQLQSEAQKPSSGPLTPVRDFLGLPARSPVKGAEAEPGESADNELYHWPEAPLGGYKFRFLIAGVPDPVDSGFAYMFDQLIEALQRALSVDDFIIDRAWLPWQAPTGTAPPRLPARMHEKHPGMILFRSTRRGEGGEPKQLLALLLVGETPTAGLHKGAFQNAIRFIHRCPWASKEEGNRVRVIGPFFSGSAVSLRMALQQARTTLQPDQKGPHRTPEPLLKVVCGSARGFYHDPFRSGWAIDGKERAFETTILPDELVLAHLWDYLAEQAKPTDGSNPGTQDVVVLQEANTGFGQHADQITRKKTSGFLFYRVPFPFHISQLRAVYTKEQLSRLESQGLPRSGRNLPFPRGDSDNKETQWGALRAQDPLMTATTNDLVLNNLVTVLAQKRVRRVCLVSTDPQDTIFLARLIRDRHPDIQLLAPSDDLLFTHEDYNYALRGMIVVGTYPLYPGFQRWSDLTSKRSPSRVLFSHEAFQGCYNAALVHLAGVPEPDIPARRSDILGHMLDYGWERLEEGPKRFTRPAIWISVVGSNGQLVPLSYVSPADYSEAAVSQYVFRRDWPSTRQPSEQDFGMADFPNLSFVLFLVFLLANAYFLYYAERYVRGSRWDGSAAQLCCRYKQRIDFGVVCLAQILLYGQLAIMFWVPLARPNREESLYAGGAAAIVIMSVGMMIVSYVLFLRVHSRQQGIWNLSVRRLQFLTMTRGSEPIRSLPAQLGWLSKSGFWVALFDVLAVLILTLTLGCLVWRIGAAGWRALASPSVDDLIRFERLVHFNNGVSPVLPRVLFCTALFGWGYCLVKKMYLANRCDLACPFPNAGPHAYTGLNGIDQQIRSELMPPSTLRNHFWECAGLFGFVAVVFVKFWGNMIPPLDGWWYGHITLLGFSVGSLLLLFTLVQFYHAWHEVRKMLRFLALLPMQSAFQRLSGKVVSIFGGYLHSLRPRHSHLGINVQQFQRLQRLFPAFYAELQTAATVVPPVAVGELSAAAVVSAWTEVQAAFPTGQLAPAITGPFNLELQPDVEEDLQPPAAPAPAPHEWGGQTGRDCSLLAQRCLAVLQHFWPIHSMEEAFGQPTQTDRPGPQPGYLALPRGNPLREWAVAAEDFCAIEITRYLSQFIVQLRTLLTSLTIGALLLLLAATVYPFFPQYQLLLFLTVLSGATVAAIVLFLIQLNRDEVISRINRSQPNRFTPDLSFVQGAATYVLPIVAAFMVQFPIVTSTLRSLIDPLFHIVR